MKGIIEPGPIRRDHTGARFFPWASAASLVLAVLASDARAAATLEWAAAIGGTNNNMGQGIAVDAAGHVYSTGFFSGTVIFAPGPDEVAVTSQGGADIFVHKVDGDGKLVWVQTMGGIDSDHGAAIALDAGGNVYTTGFFRHTVDFDPGPGTFPLTSAGDRDVFVQKLDSEGNLVWARSMGGAGSERGVGIAVDGEQNVYITGQFEGTADFDPGPNAFNLVAAGGPDIFVVKLDSDGGFVWARSMGGAEQDLGVDIVVDGAGNIYGTGWFRGSAQFDPFSGAFNLTSAGAYDTFVQKLDNDGNFIWTRSLGGTGDVGSLGIALDSEGNVYTTGFFEGAADFDPGPDDFTLTSAGGDDIFVTKLDTHGNLVWARTMGGASDDGGLGIALDSVGNVYTTGFFEGTADFDPGQDQFTVTSKGGQDIFLQKLDSDGNFVWARSMGGLDDDLGRAIVVDAANNIYLTGNFHDIADFDPGPGEFNLASAGFSDAFVVKLSDSGGSQTPGDVNGDGTIDAVDVQLVINAALGLAIDPAFNPDVNNDGVTNAVDVQLVINAALGIDISGQL